MSGCAANNIFAISSDREIDLLMWVLKWFAPDQEERSNGALDIMELVQLLQCAGFQFHKFEFDVNSVTYEPITLELTCGKSGITATMTSTATISCSCPALDKLITATNARIEFDPAKYGFVADILKILASIFAQTNKNRNELTAIAHGAWEVDPNTTPPTDTSSPMPDICRSPNVKLHHLLKQIQTLAASSLELLECPKNTTFIKESNKTSKCVSDTKPPTPAQDAASSRAKPSTPARSMVPKIVTSKVDSFRMKPSQMVGGKNAVKDAKSIIPRVVQKTAEGLVKGKIASKK